MIENNIRKSDMMGTRHMISVVRDGEYRVAQYGQWDGYPEGQGLYILRFLREGNVSALKENVLKCRFITDEEYKMLWHRFGVEIDTTPFIPMEVSQAFTKQYPQLSRDTGSDILKMVASADNGISLLDDYSFAADSVFCEWAYVIDFDKNTFEVYEGFNTTPLKRTERFYPLQCEMKKRDKSTEDVYYPVRLIVAFSLSDIPTDEEFITECKAYDDDEEDNA